MTRATLLMKTYADGIVHHSAPSMLVTGRDGNEPDTEQLREAARRLPPGAGTVVAVPVMIVAEEMEQ